MIIRRGHVAVNLFFQSSDRFFLRPYTGFAVYRDRSNGLPNGVRAFVELVSACKLIVFPAAGGDGAF
jgi:hypothetical protein